MPFYLAGVVLVIVGLLGTVLPLLPGPLFVFAGLTVAAYGDDFTRVGPVGLTIIAVLGLLSWGADFAATLMGAKRVGASPQALIGATLGGAFGLFLGLAGMIIGPFVGAVAGELIARRQWLQAGKVGLGTWLGLVAAAVVKVILAFMMIATFLAFHFLNAPK
ncbi:MAG TPA: DUF456 family protein [Usitatibacter sp.]|nr:DUF456 family protein [Usitatibacter sp.]